METAGKPNHDAMCLDKIGRQIQEGDIVAVRTIASWHGNFRVSRAAAGDFLGELCLVDVHIWDGDTKPSESREPVFGFYQQSLEVLGPDAVVGWIDRQI